MVKRQRLEHLQQMALRGELTSQHAAHPPSDKPPKAAFLVFLDSTDLHWYPDVGNTYALKGNQTKVNSPGLANPWYALFGSLIFPAGEGLYTVHQRKRSDELLVHLTALLDMASDAFLSSWTMPLHTPHRLSNALPNSTRHGWSSSIYQPTRHTLITLSVCGT